MTLSSRFTFPYDNNLLFVESAMYATRIDKPAAKISELTHGPLKAPGCETATSASGVTDDVSAPERCALRTAAKPSSSNNRTT